MKVYRWIGRVSRGTWALIHSDRPPVFDRANKRFVRAPAAKWWSQLFLHPAETSIARFFAAEQLRVGWVINLGEHRSNHFKAETPSQAKQATKKSMTRRR